MQNDSRYTTLAAFMRLFHNKVYRMVGISFFTKGHIRQSIIFRNDVLRMYSTGHDADTNFAILLLKSLNNNLFITLYD